MQIGVLSVLFGDRPLEETLDYLNDLGVDAVELACGGFVGDDHLSTDEYLHDEGARDDLLSLLDEHDMDVSALATHNNPIHPDEEHAERADRELREAIELASELGVETVTTFSGLPGGAPEDVTPNWVTAPWPTEHSEMLDYQWEEVAVPYWSDIADYADERAVDIAIEMHPNMLVYEPHGMARLREATGERIGANFDPSHLYWQGIGITDAIRFLGDRDAINHFHAKDTRIYEANARTRGVLDTAPYMDEPNRSWLFRSVGFGHGEEHWKDVVSTLRMVGYDGTLSIEHEDSLATPTEGLEKAVDVLQRAVFTESPGEAYWA